MDSANPIPSVFCFQEAVAYAHACYPEQSKRITFIDWSASTAKDDSCAWLIATKRCPVDPHRFIKIIDGSFCCWDQKNDQKLIVIRDNDWLGVNTAVGKWIIFLHELGHAVVDGAITDLNNFSSLYPTVKGIREEIGAEIFAVLHGVRMGILEKPHIVSLIKTRRVSAWYDYGFSLSHLTSDAIEETILYKGIDRFCNINPDDIRSLSQHIMNAYAPTSYDINRAYWTLSSKEKFFAPDDIRTERSPSKLMMCRLRNTFNACDPASIEGRVCAAAITDLQRKNMWPFPQTGKINPLSKFI